MEISAGFKMKDHKIGFITSLGFLFGLSVALVAYLGSSYYKEVAGADMVSMYYLVSFSILLVSVLNLHRFFLRFGRPRTLLGLLLAQIVVLFILSLLPVGKLGAVFLVIYYILYGTIWVVWDAVLEVYSEDSKTGRIRGMFLSVWGIGAIIGPMLSLSLFEKYGFSFIFLVVLSLYALIFVIALVTLRDVKGKMDPHVSTLKEMIHKITDRKPLWQVYWVAISLSFAASTLVVFIPLKLQGLGFAWSEMGLMFTIMLLPFVLLEYPAGILADKKLGEKEIMITGFLVLIVAISLITFVDSTSFVVWTSILVLSRVGYALIESMRDTYFYKQIDGKDVALINIFRTARPGAYILSMLFATVLQYFFGPQAVFFGLLIVLLIGMYPAIILKDTDPTG